MPVSARLRAELRWKLLVARLLVSTIAILLTVLIVPGLSVDGDWRWTLVLGAVFGVLNAVVKPALQVLTIRYLFLSWGLVLLAVNVATLWLLELLVPPLDIEGGLSLLLGALVLGLLVPLLEALVGTVRPIVESHPAAHPATRPAPAATTEPAAEPAAGPAPAGVE
jgi:putative membrane protein